MADPEYRLKIGDSERGTARVTEDESSQEALKRTRLIRWQSTPFRVVLERIASL